MDFLFDKQSIFLNYKQRKKVFELWSYKFYKLCTSFVLEISIWNNFNGFGIHFWRFDKIVLLKGFF